MVLPPDSGRGRRGIRAVAVSLLGLGLVLALLLVWATSKISPSGGQGDAVERLTIPKGASTSQIASTLAEEGVISGPAVFGYYARLKGAGGWKAGDYVGFRTNSSYDQAIEVLDNGPVPVQANVVRVTEGKRLVDALAQIAEQMPGVTVTQLQEALRSGEVTSSYLPEGTTNFEGLLFPDTYEFAQGTAPAQILQTMATKMEDVLDELGYQKAESRVGRSPYEVVTIASLIEKEAGAPPDEKGKISRVIENRLDDGEALGIDASVLYGLGRGSGGLTKKDLAAETPYNTRKVRGLPPTPICLPGRAALAAAIEPPEGSWKYYVLTQKSPPAHFFTDDYDAFVRAKNEARAKGVF
ncbi:MAG: endolytic transglycosylase MltG [Actinomycetes bacterium]